VDASAAVELPAAAAKLGVFLAMIATTDGTWLGTNRADRGIVDVTGGSMFLAKTVAALELSLQMLGA
jgi:hypothetical protein